MKTYEILDAAGVVENVIVSDDEQFVDAMFPGRWRQKTDDVEDLPAVRAARIARIKAEAEELIVATDWQLQRARERAQLNPVESEMTALYDVLMRRERIRQSSSTAEAFVGTMLNAEKIAAYEWDETLEPMPKPAPLITRFAFAQRFKDAEAAHPAAQAAMATLSLVPFVDMRLINPILQQLVGAGALTAARAEEIETATITPIERPLV